MTDYQAFKTSLKKELDKIKKGILDNIVEFIVTALLMGAFLFIMVTLLTCEENHVIEFAHSTYTCTDCGKTTESYKNYCTDCGSSMESCIMTTQPFCKKDSKFFKNGEHNCSKCGGELTTLTATRDTIPAYPKKFLRMLEKILNLMNR